MASCSCLGESWFELIRLNFLIGLHQRLGVNIPEADYAQLVTLDNVLDYLQARLSPAAG